VKRDPACRARTERRLVFRLLKITTPGGKQGLQGAFRLRAVEQGDVGAGRAR
jgi:hypothetical protein